ncbi:MAG: glycoside hydrolase family 9 protein [Candidatus Marinimicrobia bacterium]|nr:glycoside hydrolase family 9 protein [Candidatus Neomarinimicrobiota bacterium]
MSNRLRFAAGVVVWFLAVRFLADAGAAVELQLVPHVGEWEQSGAAWQTGATAPACGWYLRSPRQYDLQHLSFEVESQNATGFIFAYLKDWQFEFSAGKLRARHTAFWGAGKPLYRLWTHYLYTASRDIRFEAGQKHVVGIGLDGQAVRVTLDGQEVMVWRSPKEEWLERIQKSGRVRFSDQYALPERLDAAALAGKNQIIVLHAFNTPARFANVQVIGTDTGEAEGFVEPNAQPNAPHLKPDTEFARLAPDAPVAPANALDAEEQARAAALPPVTSWRFAGEQNPDLVDPAKYFGEQNQRPLRSADYLVGAAEPGKIPAALQRYWRSILWGADKLPQQTRLYFNLKDAGEYTLMLDSGYGMGWGPNELEIRVDGTPVSRELYRAICQGGHCAPIHHWVPLRLTAGPHRIDLELTETLVKQPHYMMKHGRIPIHALALEPGIQAPEFRRRVGQITVDGEKPAALAAPASAAEQAGGTLAYRLGGLVPGGRYALKLTFYEVDAQRPGDRLMDLFINGQLVEQDLDIVKAHGWLNVAECAYPAQADEQGELLVRLKGKNFKAFVNALAVVDDAGQTVWAENCGWTAFLAQRIRRVEEYAPRTADLRFIVEPTPPSETDLFDGHNLVVNPHFSLADQDGKPVGWYSALEMRAKSTAPYSIGGNQSPELAAALKQAKNLPNALGSFNLLPGQGEYALDPAVGHEQPGALRIGKTEKEFALVCNWPPVDFNKTQQFSFHAKTAGLSGEVFGEILWYAADMNAWDYKNRDLSVEGTPLRLPRLQFIGRDPSPVRLTGTHDWTRIAVTAKPPHGAIFALLAVRVEHNTAGTVWVDDASFDGYGAEPLEIEMSLLGFHPASDKQAVIKSRAQDPVKWELRDGQGQVVRSGVAAYHNEEWYSQRHYFIADFSELKEPGRYRLTAVQSGVTVSSPEFRVDRAVYRDLARISLNGLQAMRMNGNLPGFHGPEALEDALLLVPSGDKRFNTYENLYRQERMNASGGYFDAGDEIKHAEFWPTVIQATCGMWQNLSKTGDAELAERALDEFRYALDSFLRCQLPDGAFVLNIKPNVQGTDNIPYYSLDRYAQDIFPAVQAAGVCAMAARALQETDPDLARRSAAAAKRNYERNRLWEVAGGATSGCHRIYSASKALWAELNLAALYPTEVVYQERMTRHAEMVAHGLRNGDYRGSSELYNAYNMPAAILQDPIWVACDFLADQPDSPVAPALREGLAAFVGEIRKLSAIDAWGQARSMEPPGPGCNLPDRIPGYWALGYWPMLSYSLVRIGGVLDDPDLLHLAERQMQWTLGKNFGGVSGIHGVSDRTTASGGYICTRDLFFEDWLAGDRTSYTFDGAVPKTFMRGLAFGYETRSWETGSAPLAIVAGDDFRPPFYVMPPSFCATIPQADYPVHPAIAEYGLSQIALHAMPSAWLHAALEGRQSRSPPVAPAPPGSGGR